MKTLYRDIFIDLGSNFAVGKFADRDVTERDMQLTYNTPSQIGVSVPRKDHHLGHAQYLEAEGNLDEYGKWQGRLDSNQRMAGSKPAALPLGDAPVSVATSTQYSVPFRADFVTCDATSKRCFPLLQTL